MTAADLEDMAYLRDVQDTANRRYGVAPPARSYPLELLILGEPLPSARARSKAGQRPYTPARTRAAEQGLTLALREALSRMRYVWDPAGNWSLAVIFYRSTLRSVDGDNLVRLLKDAATDAEAKKAAKRLRKAALYARVWNDDRQCTHEDVTVDLDRERPRTVLRVARHTGTRMVR